MPSSSIPQRIGAVFFQGMVQNPTEQHLGFTSRVGVFCLTLYLPQLFLNYKLIKMCIEDFHERLNTLSS